MAIAEIRYLSPDSQRRTSRPLIRLILTDVQFWLPFAMLIAGIALVTLLNKK